MKCLKCGGDSLAVSPQNEFLTEGGSLLLWECSICGHSELRPVGIIKNESD